MTLFIAFKIRWATGTVWLSWRIGSGQLNCPDPNPEKYYDLYNISSLSRVHLLSFMREVLKIFFLCQSFF